MQKIKKLLALLLSVAMLLSIAAVAEDAAAPEAAPEPVFNDDDVIATFCGEPVIWSDAKSAYNTLLNQYGMYYDMNDKANVELFAAVALQNVLYERVIESKGVELELDKLTDEELAAIDANVAADWEAAVQDHVSYFHSELTAESSEEDRAAAVAEAEKYWNDMGYSLESLKVSYRKHAVADKVEAYVTQDAVVTDEDVEAEYQALVAADKEAYENNLAAYVEYCSYVDQMEQYAMMSGQPSSMEKPWYKPAGYRAVKHILLPVDEELMSNYNDLSARYEEQQHTEEAAETPAEGETEAAPEATAEPVTEQQVNDAKAAILASRADTIDEINLKVSEGADFDQLIAEYAVKADGTPSDPGSVSEPYKTTGYEVAPGTMFVPEFIEAAFSIESVGGVSAPYISQYGIHIVKYVSDVPAGPVEMTDAQRAAKQESMLQTKRNELFSAAMEQWIAETDIVYTGLVRTPEEIQAAAAAEEEAEGETEAVSEQEAEEAVTEETAAE